MRARIGFRSSLSRGNPARAAPHNLDGNGGECRKQYGADYGSGGRNARDEGWLDQLKADEAKQNDAEYKCGLPNRRVYPQTTSDRKSVV